MGVSATSQQKEDAPQQKQEKSFKLFGFKISYEVTAPKDPADLI